MNKRAIIIYNYFFLLIILFAGFWSIIFFRDNKNIQIFSSFLMGVGYVLWGILHHLSLKSLHIKVVVEYLMFATIVFVILSILILRS